mgnify:CR=1 FL=1
MSDSSSNVVEENPSSRNLLRTLAIIVSATWFVLILWAIDVSKTDPFVKSTLNTQGSIERGAQLFKVNCAGCHGIKAQGLLGPSLKQVRYRLSDAKLIHQVIEGKTPPMPSFQMKPQTMSDLLEYLHTIN